MSEQLVELAVTEGHHKIYIADSPSVEIPKQDVLGNANSKTHGMVLQKPGESMPYASVRPPFWRSRKNDPEVHAEDLVPLHAKRVNQGSIAVPSPYSLNLGSEIEVMTLHRSVRDNGHERIVPFWNAETLTNNLNTAGLKTSPEVWQYMLEVNATASPKVQDRVDDFYLISKTLAAETKQNPHLKILPVSSQPFIASPEHVNQHPYVQRIVIEALTYKVVEHLGTSFQVHVEMVDVDSAIFAINAMRHLPHLFMATALNGPFLEHQMTDLLSTRELARRRMPTAGTMYKLEDWDKTLQYAVGMLKIGQVPSLPRAISQHKDFRLRPDIKPQGTIEIAFLDNPGSHVEKMLMLQEALRLTSWRLYRAYHNGEKLPEKLFGGNDNTIEFNKEWVERYGSKAQIIDGEYNPTTVSDQLDHLFLWIKKDPQFMDNPDYSLKDLQDELQKSLTIPAFLDLSRTVKTPTTNRDDIQFDKFVTTLTPDQLKDLESRSMHQFYSTNIGTPGHYQRAYFEYLHNNLGLSETQSINAALVDYADSYYSYIQNL